MKATNLSVPALLALSIALTGCGVGPGPDLAGPSGASYLSAYSGEWTLLRFESDDLDEQYREAMAARPGASAGGIPGAGAPGGRGGGMTGGRAGGGMTGGRDGGGRMPGGMPGAQGGMNPEDMQRVMRANQVISRTPATFTLALRPESVTLTQGEASTLVLALGGDESTINQGEVEYFAGAKWTSEGLILERKVDLGGGVTDKINLDDEGHLVIEREIDTGRAGKVSGTLRYRRN